MGWDFKWAGLSLSSLSFLLPSFVEPTFWRLRSSPQRPSRVISVSVTVSCLCNLLFKHLKPGPNNMWCGYLWADTHEVDNSIRSVMIWFYLEQYEYRAEVGVGVFTGVHSTFQGHFKLKIPNRWWFQYAKWNGQNGNCSALTDSSWVFSHTIEILSITSSIAVWLNYLQIAGPFKTGVGGLFLDRLLKV